MVANYKPAFDSELACPFTILNEEVQLIYYFLSFLLKAKYTKYKKYKLLFSKIFYFI